MHRLADRLPLLPTTLRVALALFVVAWIFGPYELRSAVPVWIAFLIALGLELNFLLGALVSGQAVPVESAPRLGRGDAVARPGRVGLSAFAAHALR